MHVLLSLALGSGLFMVFRSLTGPGWPAERPAGPRNEGRGRRLGWIAHRLAAPGADGVGLRELAPACAAGASAAAALAQLLFGWPVVTLAAAGAGLLLPTWYYRQRALRRRAEVEEAVGEVRRRLGDDMASWQYGQPDYKHATIFHPLSRAVSGDLADLFTVGPLPRGGNSQTLNNTGGGDNQTSGASFRIIVDTGDWDLAMGSNTPGQSGDPASPFYENLFELWANDRYFPVFYSRERVESVAAERTMLVPGG